MFLWKFIEIGYFMLDFGNENQSVNFYSVQISPNTSPAHRFHWLAAQFCTELRSSLEEFAGIRKLGGSATRGLLLGRLS